MAEDHSYARNDDTELHENDATNDYESDHDSIDGAGRYSFA